MLDLNAIAKISYENAKKRQENGGKINPDAYPMLKHTATEVIEAMQAFDEWQTDLRFGAVSMGVTDPGFTVDYKQHFADELADIICCCTIIAGRHNLDIEGAVIRCIERNKKRANKQGDKL